MGRHQDFEAKEGKPKKYKKRTRHFATDASPLYKCITRIHPHQTANLEIKNIKPENTFYCLSSDVHMDSFQSFILYIYVGSVQCGSVLLFPIQIQFFKILHYKPAQVSYSYVSTSASGVCA